MDRRGSARRQDEGPSDHGASGGEQSRDDPPLVSPASRRIPGDLGWRLDDGSSLLAEPGGVLRAASVVPFVVLGAVAVIALVGWAVFFVLGLGPEESVWTWAAGRSRHEILTQVTLVLLLGLGCLGVLLLAVWATLRGFRADAARWFWRLWELVGVAGLVALVVIEALPRSRHVAGLRATDVAFLAIVLATTTALFRLREIRAPSGGRDGAEDAG